MKRRTALAVLLLLALLAFSACADADSGDQTPKFLSEVGKTLNELKAEHPDGEYVTRLDAFPDCAAACLEEADAEYSYYLFGLQSGDIEKALNECEDSLDCAGFITTAGVLFPTMEEEMSFKDFFVLIGVQNYVYFRGEPPILEGWLRFTYNDMQVMINTNEINDAGGWSFTGEEVVRRDMPASIIDVERSDANSTLADPFLFD